MEMQHFKEEMNRLDLAYSQTENQGKRFMYWQRLNSATDDQFTEAVNRVLLTEKFFPTIATLHGTIMRVQEEWAAAYKDALPEPERFNVAEVMLPLCDVCLDLGWYLTPNPHTNQPDILTRCECGAAVKGTDHRFHRNQHSASMYSIERDHARYPAFQKAPIEITDPETMAADLADRLRMDRRTK